MPRRSDIHRVLIIGSGPIVIGQACEFDYSGTQACKALREEGISVVLVNSNPATIMTDPEFAERTYIEPVVPETIDKLLAKERARGTPVDSLLPTLGGQTGLNCALRCHQDGILERHGVRMLGASPAAIEKAEDRLAFRDAMLRIGLDVPRSGTAGTLTEALAALERVKLPCVIRPAFTLGGSGGGFARTRGEFEDVCRRGLEYSPIRQVLIEESLWGWKEFELEVMRDRADNVVVVCSIENFDPMGVHTGDSITVAPAQTLSDKEYQRMRDAALAIIREIGVETGGSNIQFAVEPRSGRMCVIEMNPRVSRSSALASKATGFPIARIATKLAVGYTLDEIPNDITRTTPACFEPAIDYCVVKIPRWTFEKFPEADETLTTQMKSVGEGMAIGRTFKEALQKCIRSMEIKRFGLGLDPVDKWLAQHAPVESRSRGDEAGLSRHLQASELVGARVGAEPTAGGDATPASPIAGSRAGEAPGDEREARAKRFPIPDEVLIDKLSRPAQGRLYYIRYAFKQGWSVERVAGVSHVDPWFLDNIRQLVEFESDLVRVAPAVRDALGKRRHAGRPEPTGDPASTHREWEPVLRRAKQWGYSDVQLARIWALDPHEVRALRARLDLEPAYKLVDTCAAEFEAATPYYYSAYEAPVRAAGRRAPAVDDELRISDRPKVVVLGGGPNRIGQGIEFDYCCVHAAMAARELGYEAVMVNSNPETVSTDYDTSDLLFFEPLTHEDVLNVCQRLNARDLDSTTPVLDLSGNDAQHSMLRLGPGDPPRDDVLRRIANAAARHGLGQVGVLQMSWAGGIVSVAVCDRTGRVWHVNFNREKDWADAGIEQFAESPDFSLSDYCGAEALQRVARFRAAPLLRGVICQFGGQTPLNLAMGLEQAGVPILGTSPASIHLAEDREQFAQILRELELQQPPNGIARNVAEAAAVAERIGYPVLVRPSFVLGGRAMEICNTPAELRHYMNNAAEASGEHPVLIDRFLDDATEVDVDAVCDGQRTVVCGVLEHIEQAGIHSGDSSMSLPPFSLSAAIVQQIRYATERLARRIGVVGLMNVQFAIKDEDIYVLEVNPRASRTIPFVAKATGIPWARIAAKVMLGKTLHELGVTEAAARRHVAVKMSVFPFNKFPGVDVVLGPEMRSTGEVMGVDERFSTAFAKAQMAASLPLPMSGRAFVSVNPRDRPLIPPIAHDLARLGFELVCTHGTGRTLRAAGLKVTTVRKIREGSPHPLELIEAGQIALVINTPGRVGRHTDEGKIRAAAALHRVPIFTTITGARAAVSAIGAVKRRDWNLYALQDLEA